MPQFSSFQEEVIHGFSQYILGQQALFCPDLYGTSKALKEPADIAWVANRCAILFYAKSGKGKFEKKRNSNLKQMTGWLNKWSGHWLTGSANGRKLSFRFTDVDHVVAISVVSNETPFCQYHEDMVRYLKSKKLVVCATITESVIEHFLNAGFGPRDIVYILKAISVFGNTIVDEAKVLEIANDYMSVCYIALIKSFGCIPPTENAASAIREAAAYMAVLKGRINENDTKGKTSEINEITSIGCDLTIEDTVWVAIASSHVRQIMENNEKTCPNIVMASRSSGIYSLRIISATNTGVLEQQFKRILDSTSGPGFDYTMCFDIGKDTPISMFFIQPRKEQPSELKKYLDSI